jgi:hypothetical protein
MYAIIKMQYIYILMCNGRVAIIIEPIYRSALQQLREKLQTNNGERKHINIQEVNRKQR